VTEKPPVPIERASTAYADWPTLIERAVDDVSHILRSEAHMFQTGIRATVEQQLSNALAHLATIAVIIIGALCLLGAAIFLLHQWLPWWQAFGSAGLATLLAGISARASMKPRTEV
jgi:hypothetical protein